MTMQIDRINIPTDNSQEKCLYPERATSPQGKTKPVSRYDGDDAPHVKSKVN